MSIEFSVNYPNGEPYYTSKPIPAGESLQFVHQQTVNGETVFNFFEAACYTEDNGGLIRRMALRELRIIDTPEGPTLDVTPNNFLFEDAIEIANGEAGQRNFPQSGDVIVFKHSSSNQQPIPSAFLK